MTERLVADALAALDAPQQAELDLTQEHPLICSANVYAELFARGAAQVPDPTNPKELHP